MESVVEYECDEGRCRYMFWEFIYIVVIPGAVVFFIVFITSILMCCASCSRKKKPSVEDETQLLGYNSIRRASISLRQLSHNRETPLLSSRANRDARTASLNLDGETNYRRGARGTASAPGTLQRDRERQLRHQRDRHTYAPPGYNTLGRHPGAEQSGSGVQYAELNHALTAAAVGTSQELCTVNT